MANMIQCIHCKNGRFMQWMKNPIICECTLTGERFVAESVKVCPTFEAAQKEVEITHYDQYDEG
ncbi:MAG: hypothetical protein J6B92_03175 [Paraprevotella sp.]|nr:hypothetical protein [Paraprevotella sp.]MBP3470852.1 hypothetical protein [Paraprevotella sp.]